MPAGLGSHCTLQLAQKAIQLWFLLVNLGSFRPLGGLGSPSSTSGGGASVEEVAPQIGCVCVLCLCVCVRGAEQLPP